MTAPLAAMAALPSLRQRLSRFVVVLALGWVALASLALALWVRHEVYELLDDGLVASSEALAAVFSLREPGAEVESEPARATDGDAQRRLAPVEAGAKAAPSSAEGGAAALSSADADRGETPFAWQLADAQGRVLQRSPNAPAERMAVRVQPGLADGHGGWRVHVRAIGHGHWLVVGQAAGERREDTLEVMLGTLAIALLVSLVGLAWLRWRLDRETQPLDDLADVLGRYDPMRGEAGLPAPALRELAPVHEAVQALGRRLAAHAEAERAFSAHAAHALRTPLAGLDAQLAVALREAPDGGELQARLGRMRGATARLTRVVGALLALFRSSIDVRRAPVDVEALLARVPLEGLVVEVARPVARPLADADLLAAALMNLLDNAVRHGARRVRVEVREQDLTLRDDGPGVDAARLGHLRQALTRGGAGSGAPEQAPTGPGLGLALADRVARAHGGRLELLDAPQGFAVRLWLAPPGAAPTPCPGSVSTATSVRTAPPAASSVSPAPSASPTPLSAATVPASKHTSVARS